MDQRRAKRALILLLSSVALAVLAGGCGSDKDRRMPASGTILSAATPTAGVSSCAACHNQQTAEWLATRHANAEGGLNNAGSPSSFSTTCTSCHDPLGDSNNLMEANIGNVARPVVGCESCHGPGSLHVNAGGAGPISRSSGTFHPGSVGAVSVSSQFALCTSCHQLLNSAGTGTTSPKHTDAARIITDTHYAQPNVWSTSSGNNSNAGTAISGYAIDFNRDTVCIDCHNPHGIADINKEWAQSAHADRYGSNTADPLGFFSGAWAHYNWSCDGTSTANCGSYGTPANRMACQRCHTTSGFKKFADALKNGDQTTAAGLRAGTISAMSYTTSAAAAFKPEMLTCSGCHTNNNGALRDPGSFEAQYDVVMSYPTNTFPKLTYSRVSHQYPDVNGSNICIACHTGREAGESIKQLNIQPGITETVDFANLPFNNVNSHYLAAGGTVFGVTGYEFDARSYDNPSSYRHDNIGTASEPGTGTNGPCVGCHMSRPNGNGNHLFLPVVRSAGTGTITAVTSEVCFRCHITSSTVMRDIVEEQRVGYLESLEALKAQLAAKGFHFSSVYPYWYTKPYAGLPRPDCSENVPVSNWQSGGTVTTAGAVGPPSTCTATSDLNGQSGTGKNNIGAAFNFGLLEHDPGGYVHNRMYVKRLIYDSIDWIDDNKMNYSVGATMDGVVHASQPWQAEAKSYLLPNGALGIAAERP